MNNNAAIWLIAGVLLILGEFIVPGLIVIFFGVGAIITAITTWMGWTETIVSQGPVFAISSLVCLFGLRRVMKKWFVGDSETGGHDMDDDFTGHEAIVLRDLPGSDGEGRVEIKGATWKARSENPIPAGQAVIIERRDNLTLYVRPR